MIPRAVIDTNVFVSAFWTDNPASPPMLIYRALLSRKFIPVYSEEIMREYTEVLHRDKFGFPSDRVDEVISLLHELGREIVPVEPGTETFPDPDDRVFYCTALAAQDDGAVLVTGNKRHFPSAGFILTPAEFVASHLT